jgi:hypothetical protein
MTIEILLTTERSIAGATRLVLDKMLGQGFETIDGPEDGRVEVDCLNGETGEEWGFVAPDVSAMEAFTKIKEAPSTVRVKVGLRAGHVLLYPGFVALSRPEADYEEYEEDPRAKQIVHREVLELARTFGAKEVLVVGDAATDFLGNDATTWDGLKEVLEDEEVPHRLVRPATTKPPAAPE